MDSELTGRNIKVTRQLRMTAHDGLARMEKIVGRGASAHIIFSSQRHLQIAEVTVNARQHKVVGLAEAPDLMMALRNALDKAEKQAIRWKKRMVEKKRQAAPLSAASLTATMPDQASGNAAGPSRKRSSNAAIAASIANGATPDLHVVSDRDSVAKQPMTMEEAVKEVESRDRDVFVFRDAAGHVKVLHRTREGLIRLIEVD